MKSTQTSIIASLCVIILVFSGIQIAEATHLKKAEPITTKSFGIKTSYKVCGDMICPKVNENPMTNKSSVEKTAKENLSILEDSLIKKESIKNNKKTEATNNAIKFWENYYKQSAPITK